MQIGGELLRGRKPTFAGIWVCFGDNYSDWYYDVTYSDPPLGASCFSCQTSAISAGRQRLSEGHHALPGPPDGAGLLLMDPAEVPNQSEWR